MLALAFVVNIAGHRAWLMRVALLATIGPAFCYTQGGRLMREVATTPFAGEKALIANAVQRLTSPGDVVLIDPDAELDWLDFERRTGRPTWVTWKFAPTNDAELITWYRRIEARAAAFSEGCGVDPGVARPTFLLATTAAASRLSSSCGPEVFHAGSMDAAAGQTIKMTRWGRSQSAQATRSHPRQSRPGGDPSAPG